jgi:transposase
MTSTKYIGMDVHKESISIAVRNFVGKVVMECVIETKASTILQFVDGLRGDLRVTFEEGTWATWLYDLLKPRVTEIVVCNPRKNALLKDGSKSDRIDGRKLSEQLYMNNIKSVYHGEHGLRMLKKLARSYLTITKDLTRAMNRLKALYRSWGISCAGNEVYAPRHRAEWLAKISEVGVRRRAEHYHQQLDALRPLHQEARRDLLLEAKKHKPWKLPRLIPGIGAIRAAIVIAVMQTPHRFRTKRQLWTYSGLALETHDSAQYRVAEGQLERSKKPVTVRGLNKDHNHDLKDIFKGAAMRASTAAGPIHDFYEALLAKGRKPTMARLTLARKIAAITLVVWKKEVRFDADYLKPQAAERFWLRVSSIRGNRFPEAIVGLLRRSIRGEVAIGKVRPVPKHVSLRSHPMPSRTIEESH